MEGGAAGGGGGGGGAVRSSAIADVVDVTESDIVEEGPRNRYFGTTARVLPEPIAASAADAAAAPVSRPVAGARILVVDDSEANRRFAAFMARKLGCVVTAVGDGDEVVAAVAAAAGAGAPYDVVLMDLVMVRAWRCCCARCGGCLLKSKPEVDCVALAAQNTNTKYTCDTQNDAFLTARARRCA
jgi:CheY-like chemotaxis protein